MGIKPTLSGYDPRGPSKTGPLASPERCNPLGKRSGRTSRPLGAKGATRLLDLASPRTAGPFPYVRPNGFPSVVSIPQVLPDHDHWAVDQVITFGYSAKDRHLILLSRGCAPRHSGRLATGSGEASDDQITECDLRTDRGRRQACCDRLRSAYRMWWPLRIFRLTAFRHRTHRHARFWGGDRRGFGRQSRRWPAGRPAETHCLVLGGPALAR